MTFKMSGKMMVIFLTVIAPLMFLLAALFLEPPIWVVLGAILWMGIGLTMLYLPKAEA